MKLSFISWSIKGKPNGEFLYFFHNCLIICRYKTYKPPTKLFSKLIFGQKDAGNIIHAWGVATLARGFPSQSASYVEDCCFIDVKPNECFNKQLICQSLQWRHNGRGGVSNHQPNDCSLRRRSKNTAKLRVTGLCAGNSPVTKASNAENVSIWWRHHVILDGVALIERQCNVTVPWVNVYVQW